VRLLGSDLDDQELRVRFPTEFFSFWLCPNFLRDQSSLQWNKNVGFFALEYSGRGVKLTSLRHYYRDYECLELHIHSSIPLRGWCWITKNSIFILTCYLTDIWREDMNWTEITRDTTQQQASATTTFSPHHHLALQPFVSLGLLCYSPPQVSILGFRWASSGIQYKESDWETSRKEITLETWPIWNYNNKYISETGLSWLKSRSNWWVLSNTACIYAFCTKGSDFRECMKTAQEDCTLYSTGNISLWTHLKKLFFMDWITIICLRLHIYRGFKQKSHG
jgi:hypothetical protein